MTVLWIADEIAELASSVCEPLTNNLGWIYVRCGFRLSQKTSLFFSSTVHWIPCGHASERIMMNNRVAARSCQALCGRYWWPYSYYGTEFRWSAFRSVHARSLAVSSTFTSRNVRANAAEFFVVTSGLCSGTLLWTHAALLELSSPTVGLKQLTILHRSQMRP